MAEPAPRQVLSHELRTRRGPLAALCAVVVVLALGALGAAAGLEETITGLTESFPDALMAFIPGDVPGGYVVGELFNLIAPLALVAYAVTTGAATVAGEEEAGTMAVLASMPLARRALLGWKALALLLGLVVVAAVLAGEAMLAETLFGIGLEAGNVVATCVHLVLLAALFGAVALAAGGLTGSPQPAVAAGGGLAAVSYVTDAMLPLAGLDGWARLSPWHYYASSVPLSNGFDPGHAAVLLVLTLLVGGLVVLGFSRRDLRG